MCLLLVLRKNLLAQHSVQVYTAILGARGQTLSPVISLSTVNTSEIFCLFQVLKLRVVELPLKFNQVRMLPRSQSMEQRYVGCI